MHVTYMHSHTSFRYELSDLLFFIKSYKSPHPHFDINNYVSMKKSASTGSSLSGKLVHHISTTNSNRHFYFCRLPRLWNCLPSIDLNLPYATIKKQITQFLWHHFLNLIIPVLFIFVAPVPPVQTIHVPPFFTL